MQVIERKKRKNGFKFRCEVHYVRIVHAELAMMAAYSASRRGMSECLGDRIAFGVACFRRGWLRRVCQTRPSGPEEAMMLHQSVLSDMFVLLASTTDHLEDTHDLITRAPCCELT